MRKYRETWWTIAPRGHAQSAKRDRRATAFELFEGRQSVDAPCVFPKIPGIVVANCCPQAFLKREAMPNEILALQFVWKLPKFRRPARVSENFGKHGGPLPPAGLCKAGGEAERAPRFGIFLEAAKIQAPCPLNLNLRFKKPSLHFCRPRN